MKKPKFKQTFTVTVDTEGELTDLAKYIELRIHSVETKDRGDSKGGRVLNAECHRVSIEGEVGNMPQGDEAVLATGGGFIRRRVIETIIEPREPVELRAPLSPLTSQVSLVPKNQIELATVTLISQCPYCGLRGPEFDESPRPSDVCHHDPAEVFHDNNYVDPVKVSGYVQVMPVNTSGNGHAVDNEPHLVNMDAINAIVAEAAAKPKIED